MFQWYNVRLKAQLHIFYRLYNYTYHMVLKICTVMANSIYTDCWAFTFVFPANPPVKHYAYRNLKSCAPFGFSRKTPVGELCIITIFPFIRMFGRTYMFFLNFFTHVQTRISRAVEFKEWLNMQRTRYMTTIVRQSNVNICRINKTF